MAHQPQYIPCELDESPPGSSMGDLKTLCAPHNKPRRLRIQLTGAAIFIMVLLPLVGLLVQILVVHRFKLSSDSLITSASLGPTLAIAHICSTVASISVPFVLGIEAYRLSQMWLESSHTGGDNRPTPLQFGVLMDVLHGANLSAMWGGVTFIMGFGSMAKSQPLYKPHMLRRTVWLLLFLLGLAYACAGFETWLGVSSNPIPFPQLVPYAGAPPMMSRQVNQTLCDISGDTIVQGTYLCGLDYNHFLSVQWVASEGIRTLTNTSVVNSVVFSDDQTAIMAPADIAIPEDLEFSAQSYGVSTTCESVTAACVDLSTVLSAPTLVLTCPPSVNFNASFETTGILNDTGNVYLRPETHLTTNTFRFGAVVTSDAFIGRDGQFTGDTGFFTHGKAGAWNVLVCDVDVLSTTYAYSNGSFKTLERSTVTDLNMTRRIAAYSRTSYVTQGIANAVEGTGLVSGNYTVTFALELSRRLMALTGSIYEPSDSLSASVVVPTVGARLQLVPLIFLVATLFIYCLTALIIAVLAQAGEVSVPYVNLAKERLTDPLTVVHSAFGHMEARKTWSDSPDRMFSVEDEGDRLNVGPIELDNGDIAFGITRRKPTF